MPVGSLVLDDRGFHKEFFGYLKHDSGHAEDDREPAG
jgi:hypothetical protein